MKYFTKPPSPSQVFLLIPRGISQSLRNSSWFWFLLLWGTAATYFVWSPESHISPAPAPLQRLKGRSFNSYSTYNLFPPGYLHGLGNQVHPSKPQFCQLDSSVAVIIQITDLNLWTLLDSFSPHEAPVLRTWEPVSLTDLSFSLSKAPFPHL